MSAVNRICLCELGKLSEQEELDRIIVELAKHKDQVEYLEWKKIKTTKVSKEKAASNVSKEKTTYQSTKTACSASGKEFSQFLRSKWKSIMLILKELSRSIRELER